MARKSSILLDVESAARYSTCSRISACIAGWSSLVARRAHNPKVVGSNPAPATIRISSPPSAGFLLAITTAQTAVLAGSWASHQRCIRTGKRSSTHQIQTAAIVATSAQDPCDDRKNPAYVDTSGQQEPAFLPAHLLSASLSAGAQDGFYLRFLRLQCTSECPNAHDSYQKFQQNQGTTCLGLPEDTGQSGR